MGVMDGNRDGFNFGAFLLPAEDGFADARHGYFGYFAGALGAFVDYLQNLRRMLFVFYAAFADGSNPLDEVFGHGGFAPDAGGGAALADPVEAAGVAFGG